MKISRIILIIIIGVIGLFIYIVFYHNNSFYQDEFELATGIKLPESAKLVVGKNDWGLTLAIHKIQLKDWNEITSSLLERKKENSLPTSFYPEILNKIGENSNVFILKTERRYVIIGINKFTKMIFWEVWHN